MRRDKVIASDGADVTNLAQTWVYDANGNVEYYEVTLGAVAYRQTLTRNAQGKVTNISRWIKQGVTPQTSAFSSGFSLGFGT